MNEPEASRDLVLDLLRAEGATYSHRSPTRPPVRPVVYYIRWGDRIKIGFTTRLSERLRNLYHDEVIAVEPGSMALERKRHAQFAGSLIDGQREWFTDSAALRFHMFTIRDKYPELIRSFV